MRLPVIRAVVALGTLLGASAAWGQCGTTAPGGTLYGNAGTVQGPCQPLTAPVLGRNGSAGGSLTLRGATTGSVQLKVPAAAGTGTNFQFPNTNGTSGFVLQTDGSGNTSWVATTSGGTVTSVGLSLPGIFTVSGSPVTTTGTLTGTLATQGANLVWAGPTTGAASAPTFRSLVGADLPNPSASTLGGIQSTAGVSHQWISSISTLGVPGLSQPAFTDISGSITPAQCPNPSASTIGCVQSLAAVTSKWINTISTSGVPSATQPNFTDIAGNATLAQLPSLSNNTVIGNNSGGTSVPQALSASQVLDMINNVQGDVLYRNASGWVVLPPGTSGQVLTTSGAAANPAWATVTGTGTVTSIATSGGLTGGTITTTGTLSLASIATGNVLAYTGAGSGTPVATTPSAVLDVIGSTTGNILYRSSGSGWQVLAPGSNGQVLTMGASTPAWGSAGTVSNVTIATGNGLNSTGTCNISTTGTCTLTASAIDGAGGRLTLQSNTPVMATSQSAKTSLLYDCYSGNLVPYYNGSIDQYDAITSCEVSDAMVSGASAGQVVSGQVYDVWWVHGGTNRICLAMSSASGGGGGWASDTGGSNTARGTGYSQLDRTTRPYITNKNSISNCFNGATNYGAVSANQGTYLGTVYASANGQISYTFGASAAGGTPALFGVWNYYNRVLVTTTVTDSNGTWTTATSATPAALDTGGAGSGLNNRISAVFGVAEDGVSISLGARLICASIANAGMSIGFGLDVTNSYDRRAVAFGLSTLGCDWAQAVNQSYAPQIGFHFWQALQAGDGTNTGTVVSNLGGGLEQHFDSSFKM